MAKQPFDKISMNWPSQEKPEQFSKPIEEQYKGDSGDLQSCLSHHRYRVQDVGTGGGVEWYQRRGHWYLQDLDAHMSTVFNVTIFEGGAYDN